MWIKVQKVLCMFVGTDDVAISVADVQHIHCGTRSLHFPPPILSLALIQASLSTGLWSGCKQAVWWSPLRQQRYWISHTLSGQPDGDVQHYTLALPLVLCIGPAHVAGLIIGTWRGHVPQCKKKKEERRRHYDVQCWVDWKNYGSFAILEIAVCSTKKLSITPSVFKIFWQNFAWLLLNYSILFPAHLTLQSTMQSLVPFKTTAKQIIEV